MHQRRRFLVVSCHLLSHRLILNYNAYIDFMNPLRINVLYLSVLLEVNLYGTAKSRCVSA